MPDQRVLSGKGGWSSSQHRRWWSVLWLSLLVLMWGGLMVLARYTAYWAIMRTQQLFSWMLLLTYLLIWGWMICIAKRPRLMLLRGVSCTLVLAICCLCLELPAITGFIHWPRVLDQSLSYQHRYTWAFKPDAERQFRRQAHDHWTEWARGDLERGWNQPASRRQLLTFTYDQNGYRNATDLNQATVALIGDSFIEGWYVSDEETVARRLQTHLTRPVLNLGVAGYGSLQELHVLQQDAIRFQPQVVIWFFFEGNDLYDDRRFERFLEKQSSGSQEITASDEGPTAKQGWRQRSFIHAMLRQLRYWSDPILPNNAPNFGHLKGSGRDKLTLYFWNYAAVPWSKWVNDRWKKTQDTFIQAARFCRARGVHILFVFIPIKYRVYQPFLDTDVHSPDQPWTIWPIAEQFTTFCQSLGLPCLDLTAIFQNAVRDGDMPYAATDSHWSTEGHELVAQQLVVELRQRGWLTTATAGHSTD